MSKLTALEQEALKNEDVRFGFDNYEVLQQIGAFVREMRAQSNLSQSALQSMSGVSQADISRLESGAMERGPSLLTLVRLSHAAGRHLVIGLRDDKKSGEVMQLLTL